MKEARPDWETSALLMDLHSLEEFAKQALKGRLDDKFAVKHYKTSLRSVDEELRLPTLQLLDILAALICFDVILLDTRAVQSSRLGHVLLDTIQNHDITDAFVLADFPADLYVAGGVITSSLRKILHNSRRQDGLDCSSYFLESLLSLTPNSADDYIYKDMCDGYWNERFEVDSGRAVFNMGNTGESVERLFMYLEQANWLGIPATLSRRKYVAAAELAPRLLDVFKRASLDKAVTSQTSLLDTIQSAVTRQAIVDNRLSVPPLPGHILQVAEKRNMSVIEAAIWVRNSPGAAAFRAWLWSKRKSLNPIYASEVVSKRQIDEQLAELGNQIFREGGPHGIFLRRSEVSISPAAIPVLGPLWSTLGLPELRLNLPSHQHRKLYEIFIASWFDDETGLSKSS